MVGQTITSVPGSRVWINDRKSDDYYWTSRLLDTKTECVNLGSYNYLGYAESAGPCTDAAIESVEKQGLSYASSRYSPGGEDVNEDVITEFSSYCTVDKSLAAPATTLSLSTLLPSSLAWRML